MTDDTPPTSIVCSDCGEPINPATDPSFCPACASGKRNIETHDRAVLSTSERIQIEERIDQGFAFARDVIEDPRLLEEIPDGSTLRFRNARVNEHVIRLVAFLPQTRGGRWGARVTNVAPDGFSPKIEGKETAEAALDALVQEVQRKFDQRGRALPPVSA